MKLLALPISISIRFAVRSILLAAGPLLAVLCLCALPLASVHASGAKKTLVDQSRAWRVYHYAEARNLSVGGTDYWYELVQVVRTDKKSLLGGVVYEEKPVVIDKVLWTPTSRFQGVGLSGLENLTAYVVVRDERKNERGFQQRITRIVTVDVDERDQVIQQVIR
jgi:hypothetical protein